MSKYVIVHGQFYEIDDDTLMHWKYIKREKVGGKWRYYYDNGSTQKKKYEQAIKNETTWKAQAKSAYSKNLIKDGSSSKPSSVTKKLYDQPHKWTLEDKTKAAKSAYVGSPVYKKELRKINTQKKLEPVKDYIKDKLGYDEKERAQKAKAQASFMNYKTQNRIDELQDYKNSLVYIDPKTGNMVKKPGFENNWVLADDVQRYNREWAQEADEKAKKAQAEYERTPLGKYELTSKAIENAIKKGKEKIKYKIGYLEKAVSERRQDSVDYYANKVNEIEKRLTKTRKEHPDWKGSIEYDEEQLDYYRKELFDAKKSHKSAQDSYMNTPLGKLSKNEQAYEFVDSLLNGTSKKKR